MTEWPTLFKMILKCKCMIVYTVLDVSLNFTFLSPARKGRGILVAPGFCPASGVRRLASGVRRHVLLWAQKVKNY